MPIMEICDACGWDMAIATTCPADRPGVTTYDRAIRWGWWKRLLGYRLPERCRDCGVTEGGTHHVGCCIAECDRCDDQRVCCPCDGMW